MPSERDIWATANVLMKHYADAADIEAARHHDACLDRGDVEGCAVWRRVLRAIDNLRRTGPVKGEARQ